MYGICANAFFALNASNIPTRTPWSIIIHEQWIYGILSALCDLQHGVYDSLRLKVVILCKIDEL